MEMNPADIAAYIGAAAWLPQIGSYIYQNFIKPKILIVPEKQVEIGFTSFGPIFNIRLALSAEHKDVVIDSLELAISHEGGEMNSLSWIGLRETLSEISDSSGTRAMIEKEQPAIALKLNTISLVEKLVRFQNLRHLDEQKMLMNDLIAKAIFIAKNKPASIVEIITSTEFQKLMELYDRDFFWKPGKYSVEFRAKSPESIVLIPQNFQFILHPHDVEALRANLQSIKADHENRILNLTPNYQVKPITWAWRNPTLNKK